MRTLLIRSRYVDEVPAPDVAEIVFLEDDDVVGITPLPYHLLELMCARASDWILNGNLPHGVDRIPEEEPDHGCPDHGCPDCERPNQFGELCLDCVEERLRIAQEQSSEE